MRCRGADALRENDAHCLRPHDTNEKEEEKKKKLMMDKDACGEMVDAYLARCAASSRRRSMLACASSFSASRSSILARINDAFEGRCT